ncbi:Calx-beta domain-containing protein, partial [Lyngbya sp. CCY1209]|uniref:Calx-beta domain-containing protein n=1 Tax=Lyngbya sp. CCY1209 TaxID=2886103 RepID=UPI002D20E13A
LNLSNPTGGASLGTQSSGTVTILDNDIAAGTLAFGGTTFSVNEDGNAIAEITVTRTGGSEGAVSAEVTQTDDSAISPADYTNGAIAVNFSDGDTTPKTVSIPIVDDSIFEPTESLNLSLENLTGGAILGTQNTATLQIVDNDSTENLELATATYLGTAGDDTAAATVISPVDSAIIVGGNFDGSGQIRRLQDGTMLLSTTPVGGSVGDLDIDGDSGEIVAAGDFGIKVYESTANSVLWSGAGTFDRVSIANNGTVATLTEATDTVTLWSPTGTQLATATLSGTDIRPADIAIAPDGSGIYVTGFNQVSSTLQTPFLRAFDTSLAQVWNTWDYTASQVTGEGLGADTRGERITFGEDGELYFLGKTDGGNNVFQRDGQDITQNLATLVNVDSYTNFSGAGSGSFTFHAQIDQSNGNIERGQFIVTRLSSGNANSFTPESIAADEFGNVYIGGSSAATLQNRDGKTIDGQPVGNYTLGEMAVLGVSADYTVRKFWTPLTATGDADGSKGAVNSFAVRDGRAVIFGTVTQPDVATTAGAINSNAIGGDDTYLATWAV